MKPVTTANRPMFAFWATSALLILILSIPDCLHAAEKYQHLVNCDLHSGTCTQQLPDTTVSLDVTPRPVKAMTDLNFRVKLTGERTALKGTPTIDLGMPGMDMGPNRVTLKPAGPSVYEGAGVIVRCQSGRKIWQATVTLPDLGAVRFVFDVIY